MHVTSSDQLFNPPSYSCIASCWTGSILLLLDKKNNNKYYIHAPGNQKWYIKPTSGGVKTESPINNLDNFQIWYLVLSSIPDNVNAYSNILIIILCSSIKYPTPTPLTTVRSPLTFFFHSGNLSLILFFSVSVRLDLHNQLTIPPIILCSVLYNVIYIINIQSK